MGTRVDSRDHQHLNTFAQNRTTMPIRQRQHMNLVSIPCDINFEEDKKKEHTEQKWKIG